MEKNPHHYLPQVYATVTAGLLSFICGSHVTLSSSLIPQLEEEEGQMHVDFKQGSWIVSVFQYTGIVLSLCGGYICGYFGLRRTALVLGIPILLSTVLMATAKSFPVLLLGRVLSSMAIFVLYPCASIFVAEISHPNLRGTLATVPTVFLSMGMFVSYLLGYLVQWRTMFWILCSQPFIMMVAMYLVKESPHWLVQCGRKEEAEASLQWYRGPHCDISKEFTELIDKKNVDMLKQSGEGLMKNLVITVRSISFLKAFMTVSVLFFFNQFTGISSLNIFMTNVFKDSGATIDPKLAPVIVSSVRVLFTCLSSAALRTANRKLVFCSCMLTLSACNCGIATFAYLTKVVQLEYLTNFGSIPLILTIIMYMAHGFGIMTTLHLINSEVFPGRSRSVGGGLSSVMDCSASGINANLYPHLLNSIGFHGVFWFYSGFTVFSATYAAFIIPDNRGLSLIKIQQTDHGHTNPNMDLSILDTKESILS